MRFLKRITATLLLACLVMGQGVKVNAEELDDILLKENLDPSGKLNPVYTNENIKTGIIDVPAGTYNNISISANLKNVVINLDNVKVNGKLLIFGNNKRKASVIVSGNTKINALYTKRNLIVIDPSDKKHIDTINVKGNEIEVSISAVTKAIILLSDCIGSSVSINKSCKTLTDNGSENKIFSYDTIRSVDLCGSNTCYTTSANVNEVFIGGYGNRISVKSNEFGKITSAGNKAVIVGQTENNQIINIKSIEITNGSYMIVRPELLCAVTDKRSESVKASENTEKDILFIGDSFIERLYTRGLLANNMAALCAYGSSPSDWYVNGERHLDYSNELYKYNPKKIVYYYGINAIYNPDNAMYSERLLTDLMERYPNAVIYVQKIFPLASNHMGVGQYSYNEYNHMAEYSVDRYNGEIEAFCKKYTNLVWCNTTTSFIDGNGDMKRSKTVDGLHLSTEACSEWMEVIKKAIK